MTATQGSAYESAQYRHNYPDGIERHYWNVCRNRVIERLVRGPERPAGLVLDIGAGRGIVVAHLRDRGFDAWGCDIGISEPIDDSVARYLMSGTDALALEPDFRARVDTILLLDVLEHLPDPAGFLRACGDAFACARRLVITLPARRELWSNYDDHYGHYQRYDLESARALLSGAGFSAREHGYFFHALYPPMRLVAALGRARPTEVRAPASRLEIAAHRWLGRLFLAESRLLPARLPGSSLYAIAEPA